MRARKEVRLRRVECKRLNDALRGAEWFLRGRFGNAVDQHLGGGLQVVRHGREVVALRVPAEAADHVLQREGHHIVLELPDTVGLLL